MTTLFTATLELASKLTNVREGNATAVAATSITDSGAAFANGLWQGGTLWLHDTVPVTKLVELSGADKITFTSGTAPTAGVGYSVANRDYPRDVLRQAINDAIKDLHPGENENTSLVTVADQQEYDLPAGVTDLTKVEVEYDDEGSEKHYFTHQWWREVGAHLRFFEYVPSLADKTIRLTYLVGSTRLVADSDLIPARIDQELLIWKAATYALRWGLEQYGQDPAKRIVDRMNEAQAEVARRGGNKKINSKSTILSGW